MTARAVLVGRRILVVDGDYFVAHCLADDLRRAGADVLGPVGTAAEALRLIEAGPLDGAMLDADLPGVAAHPVADALAGRAVPFVFVTGRPAVPMPERHAAVPRHDKLVDVERLGADLSADRRAAQPPRVR